MLTLAAPALASSLATSAYGGPPQVSQTSTLPFTGINVGLVALIGLVLVCAGFVLYRSARATSD